MLRMEAYLNPQEIMKCYDTSQLTVLTALAREFVVCDRPQFCPSFHRKHNEELPLEPDRLQTRCAARRRR
jgi:hypothetical protein